MVAAFALTEAGRRERCRRHPDARGPAGRRVCAERLEDLDHERRDRGPLHRLRPDVPGGRGGQAADHGVPGRTRVGGEERAERAQARHPRHVDDRDLVRQRAGAGVERPGGAWARLQGGHGGAQRRAPGPRERGPRPVQAGHQDGGRAVPGAARVRAAHRRVRSREGQGRHDDGRHLGPRVHDQLPDDGHGRRRAGRLQRRERDLQGVRQRDVLARCQRVAARSPRGHRLHGRTTRTSASFGTRGST